MAWIDDRIWCHPKFADLTGTAAWVYVKGVAYSSGFHTGGRLTVGQQKTIGATAKERRELVAAGLWNLTDEGVDINDWNEHNGKRDARRAADRERKRRLRNPQDAPQERPQDSPAEPRQDGSALTVVTDDGRTRTGTSSVSAKELRTPYEASYEATAHEIQREAEEREAARYVERDDDGEPIRIRPMQTLGGQSA